jgi:hypothetical protein
MTRTHRRMKGGFLDSLSAWASDAWNKTKSATQSVYNPTPTYTSTSTPTYNSSYTVGGKKHRNTKRHYKGGRQTRRRK